jgi:peptidoglycan/xylan/chitin deacetylase (PgdA/CDA1 family)
MIERPRKRSNRTSPANGNGMGLPGPLPAGLGTAIRRSRRRMSPRQRQRLLRVLLVAAIGGTLTLGILLRGHAPNPPFRIQVAGVSQTVPAGTTLDNLVRRFSLKPRAGDLLDVEGKVLTKEAFAGTLLVNGVAVPGRTALSQGDVVTVQPGKDRTEKVLRKVVRVPGGEVPNPQFFLGKASGKQIIRTGELSGKFVSSVFRPTGSFHPPKAVALTFDDGPSPTNTRKLLKVLQRFKVKATFFVIGHSASFHPSIVKAEIAAGMEVANHSWSHPYLKPFKSLPSRVIRSEIGLTQRELLSLGATSGLFRPPGGTFSPRVIDIAKESDARLVMWSIDPKDWQPGRTSRQIVDAVLSKVGPGSIVILHDGGGDRSATIGALPGIIRGIRAKGLQIVTIGEGSNL